MVLLRPRPADDSSGSCSRAIQIDDQTRKFISLEITCNILDRTPVIFDKVKEGILEWLKEWFSTFRTEMAALMGSRTLTFREFTACGAPDYHGDRDPIATTRWLADVANAFRTSKCSEGDKV